MTIQEILSLVDSKRLNSFEDELKIDALNYVEGYLHTKVLKKPFEKIKFPEDAERKLVANNPYSVMYEYYLFSQIALWSEEIDLYNNYITLYNATLESFIDYVNGELSDFSKAIVDNVQLRYINEVERMIHYELKRTKEDYVPYMGSVEIEQLYAGKIYPALYENFLKAKIALSEKQYEVYEQHQGIFSDLYARYAKYLKRG